MANAADILLPLAGAIAGINPYLGSGIRTGFTVADAMQSRKQRREEAEREQEMTEAERERRRKYAESIAELVGDDSPQARALIHTLLAADDPMKLWPDINDFLAPKETPPPGMTIEQFNELSQAEKDRLGLGESTNVTGKIGGTTLQRTLRGPQAKGGAGAEKASQWFDGPGELKGWVKYRIMPNGDIDLVWPFGQPPPDKVDPELVAKIVKAEGKLADAIVTLEAKTERLNRLRQEEGPSVDYSEGQAALKLEIQKADSARRAAQADLTALISKAPPLEGETVSSHGAPAKGSAADTGQQAGRKVFRYDAKTNTISGG